MTTRRWSRRSLLALSVAALAAVTRPLPAGATAVTVGRLSFLPPNGVQQAPAADTLGRGWQWYGTAAGGPDPAAVVLARADLPSVDASEILGLVLSGSGSGMLPGLQLGDSRTRSTPGGGDQLRIDLSYLAAADLEYHGALLIATRGKPPSGLLAVVGNRDLTAGTIEMVLDSVRWLG